MKVAWIRGGHNCVELLGLCNRLFLKVIRVFGDNGWGEVLQVNMVDVGFEQ